MNLYNIAEINLCTEFEGPYKRIAIWFQGCNIGCEGCCNIELQPFVARHLISLEELVHIIKQSMIENGVEGITLLGGEPTIQNNLEILLKEVRKLKLGIILFTGKQLCEVDDHIIQLCDIIIDGKYDKNQIESKRNLVGSSNQKIYYLTERYIDCKDWFEVKRVKKVRVDIGIDTLSITGDVVL